MKTMNFFKNKMQTAAVCLFAATTMVNFTACTDDFDETVPEQPQETLTGLGASADSYNINDQEFTVDAWRQQEAIYMYDGEGKDYKDEDGRKGYTLVNLPWYQGDVQTNLPNGFCDDVTRENGWELVLNRCGSRSLKNNNFFAVYNKYTGTLRFFFYMPDKFTSGNDHVWEVTMTDNIAKNTALRYGLPQDCKINNKELIGLSGQTTISEYIAPWVGRLSSDGLITPNSGWWAFDVDLSTYSGKPLSENDNIRLQMRSMHTGAISLNSLIAANIDGSIKADIDLLQSQHLGNSMMGIVSKLGSMGGNAYKVVTAVQEQKWGDALSAAIGFGKTAANMCGIKTESAQDIQGTLDGTIALTMNGTITTQGMMESSEPTSGVVTPTFFLKDFDFTNAPGLGEGIWNLATSPVVYYTNAQVIWENRQYIWNFGDVFEITSGVGTVFTTDKKSPFGGQYTEIDDRGTNYGYSNEPYAGYVCYFDPTSIKLQLNPNVFTPEEIENAKVYATCGVRKSAGFGSTENYREAMGLQNSNLQISNVLTYSNPSFYASPFDAFSSQDDKLGMKANAQFAAEKVGSNHYALFGRGDDDYIVEPQALYGGKNSGNAFVMPAYEVNVTVVVEHNGQPLVYTRTYLPEYKMMSADKIPSLSLFNPLKDKPANYVTDIYLQQINHVQNIRTFLYSELQPEQGPQLCYRAYSGWHYDKANEAAAYLTDGDPNTKWCSEKGCISITTNQFIVPGAIPNVSKADYNKHVWAVDFKTNICLTPHSYTLVTANDNSLFPERRPKAWALYGKNDEGKWQLLDKKETSEGSVYALPKTNLTETNYFINYQQGLLPHFTEFHFEVYSTFSNASDAYMQLGELRFN